jgi:predicted MPP superfamily phosphohydrolase
MRRAQIVLGLLIAAVGLLALFSFAEARRDPVVRRTALALPDWPRGAAPVRIALLSDIHVGSSAMDSARLRRIVGQINTLHPDLVLIAGDFVFGNDPTGHARRGEAMVAPLSRLRAPLGTVAVLGNHDWWSGDRAVRAQLARAHVKVLDNQALVAGPLALGGIGDEASGHADLAATLRAVRALSGAHVLFTHSPDVAPDLPADMPLLLAGHTHCGQVVIPFRGPVEVSRYGARYLCGVRREGKRTVIVTAGLGTSGPPLRFRAPPDIWLVTLGGPAARAASAAAR